MIIRQYILGGVVGVGVVTGGQNVPPGGKVSTHPHVEHTEKQKEKIISSDLRFLLDVNSSWM